MMSTDERIRTANTILCRGAYRKFLRELAMASPVGALSAPQPAVGSTGSVGSGLSSFLPRVTTHTPSEGGTRVAALQVGGGQ